MKDLIGFISIISAVYLLYSNPVQVFYGLAVIALFGFGLVILCLALNYIDEKLSSNRPGERLIPYYTIPYEQREKEASRLREIFLAHDFVGKSMEYIKEKAGQPSEGGSMDHGYEIWSWWTAGIHVASVHMQSGRCIEVQVL
ncbi:MAG: hypothetical protein LBI68_05200 [Azoarcus sp.]|jgi:hypothetical protein|nr:hypothetical protein [Azoarcus sp.]